MNKHTAALPYNLRRSSRAKNTRIVVTADKIEVVAPLKVSERHIQAFVHAQKDWIEAALKRVAGRIQTAAPRLAPSEYRDGAHVPYQGRRLPLKIIAGKAKTVRIELLNDEMFWVKLPTGIADEQHSALIRQALTRWMKNQAKQHVQELVDLHGPRFALFPRSIRIKTQKSRWGSCGPKNDINMNWLLLLAPAAVLEYVVVHELCHIKHKNHSPAFWQLVAEHLPDFKQHRLWLKQYGASVMQGL
ncbi:M48 family metallopeptidase [Methylomonas rosea]|uniref:M48 family metallopeptidase n=1 Tax=Methylomonas rosea TaxID=2952227 RepID=A0ABT1TSY1_9GAMM|nr:SprT family zinc-dependent metalloprotease [Methylomonas sp. WSC-7]MCQ8117587.1 M48 family metallopeptidase [Methylomonas sp. WSC-7]